MSQKRLCIGRRTSALPVLNVTHLDTSQIHIECPFYHDSIDSKPVYRHIALDFFEKVIIVYIKHQEDKM